MLAGALKTLLLLLMIALSISSPSHAKGPKGGPQKTFSKILEVNALSISLSLGTDGNSHEEYTITDSTKVTLNGAATNARNLRSGMIAAVEVSADGKVALTITAKDAPAHPSRHRVG